MAREPDYAEQRRRMVAALVSEWDLRTDRVKAAFLRVPREAFVRPEDRRLAYADAPLPIGEGQTISAPSMIAIMLEEAALAEGERVLEVGTGSGYGAALLACLAGADRVVTVERLRGLATWGRSNLERTGFNAVRVVVGDGSLGHPEGAPYDAIVATAGAPTIPAPWPAQLATGGRIVAPIGASHFGQDLIVARKREDGTLEVRRGTPCAFVPLIGQAAWPGP